MPPIITESIPRQNFDLVGEAIGAILTLELDNQKTLQSLPEEISVFNGRITAIDKTEEVLINVNIDSAGNMENEQSGQMLDTNYFVDVYVRAKANQNKPGDENAYFKLMKYIGMCRYILQSHKYLTLGFSSPVIGGKAVQTMQLYEQENTPDTGFGRMCRIVFAVRIRESQDLWTGVALDDNIAEVKLDETEKGFQYKLKAA